MAMDFALSHPDRVAGLVLVAPGVGGYRFSEEFQKRIQGILSAWREGGSEALVQAMLADPNLIPAPRNPAARQRAATLIAENVRHLSIDPTLVRGLEPPAIGRLSEIHAPTLIVLGDRDSPELYQIADLLSERIPGARRVTVPQAGHTVPMENPQEFNRVVGEFLRELEP